MMHLTKRVNLDQLAGELEARVGERIPIQAQHDPVTLDPIAVDAETDPEVLASCVEDHVAVFPEPPPDPLDVMRDAVAALHEALSSGPPAPDLRKAMRDQLVPILRDLDPILRDLRERREPWV